MTGELNQDSQSPAHVPTQINKEQAKAILWALIPIDSSRCRVNHHHHQLYSPL
jgi:hypothetical protein